MTCLRLSRFCNGILIEPVQVALVAGVWMLVAMIIAVRQALDYRSTARAVGVCIMGWLIQALFIMLIFWLFGPATPAGSVSP